MAPREALRNAEHERKSECSAQATPDEGVLLGGTDAVGSSSEQGAHRIDGRRATCECGHYGGTHRPPETSEVLVPLGEANEQEDEGVREEVDLTRFGGQFVVSLSDSLPSSNV